MRTGQRPRALSTPVPHQRKEQSHYALAVRAELVALLTEEPPGAVDFGVNVTALLRPAGGEGEESFQLTVCTAGWVADNVAMPKGFAFLRHHLVVERWDEDLVQRAIQDLCLRNEGSDWPEVATKLSRYAYWEFEDYRE